MNSVSTEARQWFILALVVAGGWLLYLLAPVLTPFLLSALLAYLGDPLVDRLQRKGVSRAIGVLLVFGIMLISGIVALVILLPTLSHQTMAFLNNIPEALDWLQKQLAPRIAALVGSDVVSIDTEGLRAAIVAHWRQVGSVAGQVMSSLGRSGQVLLGWLAYLLLIPVVTFYLLRDWDPLVAAVRALLPQRTVPMVTKLASEIDAVLAEFLRGQLTVMLALAAIYTSGLWLVGLDLAFVMGMAAGVVSFVPYMGVIVGLSAAVVAAFLQFHDVFHLLAVATVFGVGQLLEGMVLSPLLVGDRIGLHPVAVIFAVMAGGQLFGFFGVLVALPVAAVVVVLLRHSRDQYINSEWYGP